eukprot:TRINITY_DN14984_c0_g2_i1.p1 TRINITY_DN14984_c0_g2~~TRINITY_DN14984_c0_g2_i1.p1  ORF type:complete len:202 (+),score=56.74 TRINITY_DN14984_c0_g2_i1:1-606(+)
MTSQPTYPTTQQYPIPSYPQSFSTAQFSPISFNPQGLIDPNPANYPPEDTMRINAIQSTAKVPTRTTDYNASPESFMGDTPARFREVSASSDAKEDYNVPLETFLGESDNEFVVFLRTIPSSEISLTLEARALHISVSFPSLNSYFPEFHMMEELHKDFKKKILFPTLVVPEFNHKLDPTKTTMVIRIKKYKARSLGEYVF